MTWKDPIVEEVRQAREAHAKKFNYDLDAICEDLRRPQAEGGRKIVSFPPKPARTFETVRRSDQPETDKPSSETSYQLSNETPSLVLRESKADAQEFTEEQKRGDS